eukprot:1176437-Prorocentrum_minimum.AAC.1
MGPKVSSQSARAEIHKNIEYISRTSTSQVTIAVRPSENPTLARATKQGLGVRFGPSSAQKWFQVASVCVRRVGKNTRRVQRGAREHTLAFSYYGAHANKRILACSPESPEPLSPPKQSGRDLSPVRNHLEPPASALVKGCGKHLDSEHRYQLLRDFDAIQAGTSNETVSELCVRYGVGHNYQANSYPRLNGREHKRPGVLPEHVCSKTSTRTDLWKSWSSGSIRSIGPTTGTIWDMETRVLGEVIEHKGNHDFVTPDREKH